MKEKENNVTKIKTNKKETKCLKKIKMYKQEIQLRSEPSPSYQN